jgi:hypothetical protein
MTTLFRLFSRYALCFVMYGPFSVSLQPFATILSVYHRYELSLSFLAGVALFAMPMWLLVLVTTTATGKLARISGSLAGIVQDPGQHYSTAARRDIDRIVALLNRRPAASAFVSGVAVYGAWRFFPAALVPHVLVTLALAAGFSLGVFEISGIGNANVRTRHRVAVLVSATLAIAVSWATGCFLRRYLLSPGLWGKVLGLGSGLWGIVSWMVRSVGWVLSLLYRMTSWFLGIVARAISIVFWLVWRILSASTGFVKTIMVTLYGLLRRGD